MADDATKSDLGELTNINSVSPHQTSRDSSQPSVDLNNKPLKLLHQFIDGNIKTIRYSSVALAAVGVVLLAKNVHLTSKFSSLHQIPAHFISKHVTLQGRVRSVSSGGVLHVDHTPIVNIQPWQRDAGSLPIQLALVDIREEGKQWMQLTLPNQHVWFKFLALSDSHAECLVWTKEGWRKECLNEALVREGRAVLHPWPTSPLAKDNAFDRPRKRLLKAQRSAEKKELGLWKEPVTGKRNKIYISYIKHLCSKLMSLFKRK